MKKESMFGSIEIPDDPDQWRSSGPCPSCAAKDAKIKELTEIIDDYAVRYGDALKLAEELEYILDNAGVSSRFVDRLRARIGKIRPWGGEWGMGR